MDSAHDDIPLDQPQEKGEELIQNHPNSEWFSDATKKSGSVDAAKKRKSNWFDMLLKSNIDELTIADLEGARLEMLKRYCKNDNELEYHANQMKVSMSKEAKWSDGEDNLTKPCYLKMHMSKSLKPDSYFYNSDFYYLAYVRIENKYTSSLTKHYAVRYYIEWIKDIISDRWSKEVCKYHVDALYGIHHWEDKRKDLFKAKMGNRSTHKVYSDKKTINDVSIDVKRKWSYGSPMSIKVKRSDGKEYELSYEDFSRLGLDDIEDIYLLKV
nr:hypothetical protein [Tanacetum cinerariifolium]GFB42873.1 hypothetical protein [Tanacetum cinerariifolium]